MKRAIYRNYLLGVLLLILAFNFVDRLALGLVLQDIKGDLKLTDSQLGLLTGLAFAMFYSLMGVPIARWADRGNRVAIISVTVAIWSVMVALCGRATSFLQLLLIRVGVAVGEAGCVPPAHSLIADYFSRAERPRAVALYSLGGSLGLILGYLPAGWLNEAYGWRTMFLVLGLPGLGLAALAWLTLAEPRHVRSSAGGANEVAATLAAATSNRQPSLAEVFRILAGNATFRHLTLSYAVTNFFGWGILQWQPAFFIRSYGLKSGELGTYFAIVYGIGGFLGTYLGGVWASRHAPNNESIQLKAMTGGCCSFGLISIFIYLSPNYSTAFALMGLASVGLAATTGPLFATIQTLVPPRTRAVSIAVIYLFSNLIGMGLGPLAAGVLSDALRPFTGEESLRYSLLILSPGYLWGGWHLWRANKTIARDLQMVQGAAGSSVYDERVVNSPVT